jgi:hypothetical protein
MKFCHACKSEVTVGRSIGRRDVCPRCGADLRCCLNCTFYDRAASKQCRETVSELVKEKGRANFCDYFSMSEGASADNPKAIEAQTRKALDDLFKK